jgi:hypothetical protein
VIARRCCCLLRYQDYLLPDCREPVDDIRREIDMEFSLNPDKQLYCRKRIPAAKEKVIIRRKRGEFKDIFPERCQFFLKRFDIIQNTSSPSGSVHQHIEKNR